jgi:hypothetical protein
MRRREPSYQEGVGDSRARLVPMFLFVSPRLPICGGAHAEAEQGMKRQRPAFGRQEAQGQRRAVEASVARRRRLAATQPPEPPGDDPDPAVLPLGRTDGTAEAADRVTNYRAARRMELYEQPSRPVLTPHAPATSPAEVLTAAGTLKVGDAKVISAGRAAIGDTENSVVQTAILPLFKLDAEERELLSPPPAIEPHKRKRAARAPARPRTKQTARVRTKQSAIINRVEVIRQTKALIIVLEEALDYDPVRGHNQQPPALWSADPSYLKDVKALVAELQRLNSLLEAKRPRQKEAKRAVIDLTQHLDTFLKNYAAWFGRGAAALTVSSIAGLLHYAGLDPTAVWSIIKVPR